MIYFDNAATTKPLKRVVDDMNFINEQYYANPASLHGFGYQCERYVEDSRSKIASVLDVPSECLFFTSGGTESDNTAIMGYLSANPRKGKHIITSKIEHPAVLETYKHLQSIGYETTLLDVDSTGKVDLQQLEDSIREDTSLVSVILVNNEIGTIQDIRLISRVIKLKNKDTVLFVDAVQGFGKIEIKPERLGIDMMSISGHKICGPKGIGGLYIKKGLRVNPIMFGGGQEQGFRSGTLNVPAIVGFATAANLIDKDRKLNYNKMAELKKYFSKKIKENFKNTRINSDFEDASPYILNVSFGGLKSEVLLHHLAQKEIYVSSDSACSSRRNIRSHVLEAIGAGDSADGTIRFSFSAYNTIDEVDETIEALKSIIPVISYSGGK